jgi:hypothetical protein
MAEIQKDPAISAPHPDGDPLNASKAPSSPEAPLACKALLYGLRVKPIMMLVVSPMSVESDRLSSRK